MDPDGSNPENLTNDPGADVKPAWSTRPAESVGILARRALHPPWSDPHANIRSRESPRVHPRQSPRDADRASAQHRRDRRAPGAAEDDDLLLGLGPAAAAPPAPESTPDRERSSPMHPQVPAAARRRLRERAEGVRFASADPTFRDFLFCLYSPRATSAIGTWCRLQLGSSVCGLRTLDLQLYQQPRRLRDPVPRRSEPAGAVCLLGHDPARRCRAGSACSARATATAPGRTWRSRHGVLTRLGDTLFRARLQAWMDCLQESGSRLALTGRSGAWYRALLGERISPVRIRPPRLRPRQPALPVAGGLRLRERLVRLLRQVRLLLRARAVALPRAPTADRRSRRPACACPTSRSTQGPSPAPTNTCSVPGGQCTKSHVRSGRSCSSTSRRHSPESTRKSSCSSSRW